MKRIKTFAVAAIAVMLAASGCSKTPQVSEDNAEALKEATKEELEQAVSDRDELLSLVNDISDGLNQIKTLERQKHQIKSSKYVRTSHQYRKRWNSANSALRSWKKSSPPQRCIPTSSSLPSHRSRIK